MKLAMEILAMEVKILAKEIRYALMMEGN